MHARDIPLTTDFELDVGYESFGGEVSGGTGFFLEGDFEVGGVDQVTIATDGCGHALSKANAAIEGLLDLFKSELGVATIDHLPESNAWGASKIDILSAITASRAIEVGSVWEHVYTMTNERTMHTMIRYLRDELHKTTTHFLTKGITQREKKNAKLNANLSSVDSLPRVELHGAENLFKRRIGFVFQKQF
jgi:hypothetical protein